MELITEGKERNWYLVKEFTTKHGNAARIHKCVWNKVVKDLAPSLHDFCTGYVLKRETDTEKYYDNPAIEVHGGVTFEGPLAGAVGDWVGFDLSHYGDEDILDQEVYAEVECEKLAIQML